MTEQQSDMTKCPTCGNTSITFNPPLEFEVSEACGAVKPGNYTSVSPPPECDLNAGHDGRHVCLVESTVSWPDSPAVTW